MKVETTRKFIANSYNCKYVGYADLQHLFRYYDGICYYTHGIYGWNFDAFCYGDKCITTGYRNMIGERVDRKIQEKYNNKAKAIWENRELTYQQMRKKVDKLIEKFFVEAFE